ncbi:UNC93-like protein [Galendromus occidentalis]|uniref:UNC93-like protein n=1 Tax=Galendromus occidentalis TaxID=34638 RepID=A0AAJ6QSP8_9ACAR|nr:UNC93-like protein [Galendromus occidentalis]
MTSDEQQLLQYCGAHQPQRYQATDYSYEQRNFEVPPCRNYIDSAQCSMPGTSRTSSVSVEKSNASRKLNPIYIERVILKSVLLLGLAFTCVFAPFYCLHYIQTSLFIESGLGIRSLALLYGMGTVSCWYAPAFVQHLSPSWAIVVSFVSLAVYVSTFFYPKHFTLYPSALLAGSTLGPLFSAQTSFLMHLVGRVATLTESSRSGVERRFFRMFYALVNCSRVIGTICLLFMVACTHDVRKHTHYHFDFTAEDDAPRTTSLDCIMAECSPGRAFKGSAHFWLSLTPPVSLFVVSVFLGLVFTGIALVMSLLDKFQMFEYQDPLEQAVCGRCLRAVGRAIADPRLHLLIPMAFFSGLQQGVLNADFTQLYISCTPSLYSLSFLVLLAAVFHLVTSLVLLSWSNEINRPVLVFTTLLLNALMLLLMSSWSPQSDLAGSSLFYIVSSLWGFCSGVWETLMITYISGAFHWKWEPPFAVLFMANFAGLSAAFIASDTLCFSFSVLILSFMLLAASLPYALLENKLRQEQVAKLTVAHL